MKANELKDRYIRFFEMHGHRRIPSAPLLPENDPTVLFTTAGMHPLAPFLLGEPHPLGSRLVDFQKCIRTNDIDEVGDASHLTFFEMLGNWSLNDYFKAESLSWSYEFLTRELNIDPRRLAATVFAGDETAARDEAAAGIWRSLGLPAERIFYLPRADNWWGPAGVTGPCGPDSEIFYDLAPTGDGGPAHPGCGPGCACGRWLEIWNNVFMQYQQNAAGTIEKMARYNVDTGMGLERALAALNGYDDVYQIDTLWPLVEALQERSGRSYAENRTAMRVITDHVRAATFAVADGATPSNVEAGYVVRRMVRRAVRFARELGLNEPFCADLSRRVVDLFGGVYPELAANRETVAQALDGEECKFKATLERGLRQFERVAEGMQSKPNSCGTKQISGAAAFDLFETYGFPLALTVEMARERGLAVDESGFDAAYQQHRQISRQGAEQKFKGGLADHSEATTRLHTAAHLLQAALRQTLGPQVGQKGSNITAERLRFDFSFNRALTADELAAVEALVNQQIERDLPVRMQVMPLEQAAAQGALAFFAEKYGEQVKVYTIGDFSQEVCGGPHVSRTGELGRFRITKQEAVKQGVRRIRGVLE
jgi:alanyl-tRNA synthetase